MGRALVERSLHNPLWRLLVKVAFDRTNDATDALLATGIEQVQEPSRGRELIVVDKGDEVSIGLLDCFVSSQANALARLDKVLDRYGGGSGELKDAAFGRRCGVVVDNSNRDGEPVVCLLFCDVV